jgi:hypothetical protein
VKNNNSTNVGYTYDFTTSKLLGGTYGSHEIHMSYSFDIDGRRQADLKADVTKMIFNVQATSEVHPFNSSFTPG